jgi:glycerol-3-phosphate cytidylyltransferase-like family protein
MLLTKDQLPQYRQQLAMVDGSFDPIHDGHIGYFKAASELGVPLLCNVAPDSWTVTIKVHKDQAHKVHKVHKVPADQLAVVVALLDF